MARKLPGLEGIPFYTNKSEDVPVDVRNGDLRLRGTAEVHIFDLSKQEDLIKYSAIQADVARGQCAVDKEDLQWLAKKESWKVFLKIIRYYYTLAEEEVIL
jgi:hypothetical protein